MARPLQLYRPACRRRRAVPFCENRGHPDHVFPDHLALQDPGHPELAAPSNQGVEVEFPDQMRQPQKPLSLQEGPTLETHVSSSRLLFSPMRSTSLEPI